MMDYYSEFPAPSVEEVIKDVTHEIYRGSSIDTEGIVLKNIKPSVIRKSILVALERIGGHSSLGSFTGYAMFGKKKLIHNTSIAIIEERFKYLTFKTIATTICKITRLYKQVVHNLYKPGGDGYRAAQADFNHMVIESCRTSYLNHRSLPPINITKSSNSVTQSTSQS